MTVTQPRGMSMQQAPLVCLHQKKLESGLP